MFTNNETSGWDLMDYLLMKKECHTLLKQMETLTPDELASWSNEKLIQHISHLHVAYKFVSMDNHELDKQYGKLEDLYYRSTLYQSKVKDMFNSLSDD
jgi:uncharacterized protein (DUF2225 family)